MAGEATARAEAKRLADHLERYGIRTSIELQQGRGEWYVIKYHVMNHHTATYKTGNLTPALYICKNGRTGIPGPLCNGYGGYDFVFRIITMGLANHSGEGGPISIDGVYVPKDSGRSPFFGIEWEGGYHNWTQNERNWMAVANKAITEFYNRPHTSQLEHKTWAPARKVDRKDYTREISIADTAKIGGAVPKPSPQPSLGDFMPIPVIAAPSNATGFIRPWTALLPGKVIRFVDWDPLPDPTLTEHWALGKAYWAGVDAGFYSPVKVVGAANGGDFGAAYDWAVANAQQYSRLPSTLASEVAMMMRLTRIQELEENDSPMLPWRVVRSDWQSIPPEEVKIYATDFGSFFKEIPHQGDVDATLMGLLGEAGLISRKELPQSVIDAYLAALGGAPPPA